MTGTDESESSTALIDSKIEDLGDWRGETLSRIRALIRETDPEVVEAVRWRTPSRSSGRTRPMS